MPLEPVPLESPVNVREILESSKVPLRDSQGRPVTVDALFSATPMERRTGSQISRAEMMDRAIKSAEEATVTINLPLETERIIGLYFSSSWCPPCRKFTPELSSTYSELKKQNRDFEIVFCSWDNKPEEYLDYAQKMPWTRIPFRDPRIQQLSKAFDVKGIPCLVMIRASDNGLITKDARMAVPYDPLGKKYPWNVQSGNWLMTLWNGLPTAGKWGFAGLACYGAYKLAGPRLFKR
jgi:nucleoredoxin